MKQSSTCTAVKLQTRVTRTEVAWCTTGSQGLAVATLHFLIIIMLSCKEVLQTHICLVKATAASTRIWEAVGPWSLFALRTKLQVSHNNASHCSCTQTDSNRARVNPPLASNDTSTPSLPKPQKLHPVSHDSCHGVCVAPEPMLCGLCSLMIAFQTCSHLQSRWHERGPMSPPESSAPALQGPKASSWNPHAPVPTLETCAYR